ncbi:MAG: HAD-IC family P-type ATPase, partial [Sedimenticolaceae bacterium]
MSSTWHTLSVQQTAAALQVDPNVGISAEQAADALAMQGPNRLVEKRRRGLMAMLFSQFSDFMILVLIAAAVVSGLLGEIIDSIAILVIILLNAVIGVVQEYRAERALEALKDMAVPNVTVRRDGHPVTIASEDLVPGDILLLEAGNLVPADVRLTATAALQLNEAALTGESTAVGKRIDALSDAGLAIGDRNNMAFRGTLVTYGRGEGAVVATGMDTEIGRIAQLLERSERPLTPLQQRLARFGRRLAMLVLLVCAVVFAFGLLRGVDPLLMFLTAVSLAVAAIPEALPAVITIALALGARKLVHGNALIRQLPAVETLGSVTVICSDKTGTLTQNRMQVEAFMLHGQRHARLDGRAGYPADALFAALALNNDAQFGRDHTMLGEPTEVALLQAVIDSGRDAAALRVAAPRVAELPFDADRKMMTTVHQHRGGLRAFTKGAPEALLPRCTASIGADGGAEAAASAFAPDALLQEAEDLAADGYRVLALAYRDWQALPETMDSDNLEAELVFVGLVALMDPPRPEVLEAVAACRGAGIRPIMVTGDHPVTALAIAERLGIA